MPCSKEWASSCTSSQGMPKTCTRNASIRRWRVTMRLADCRPLGVNVRRLRSSRTTKPSSTRRRTISRAVGWDTPTARARLACVGSMPASFIQKSFSRYSSTVDVRLSMGVESSPPAEPRSGSRAIVAAVAGRLVNTARRRAASLLALALLAMALPAGAGAAAPAAGGAGWTTWGNGPARQSRASSSALTTARAKRLKLAWSRPLGGVGAAQPLYLTGIASGGKRRDIYVAASESGRVSAFDARSGKVIWERELGSVNTGCLQMPKGVFGVTGTPVYDPAGGYLYVAATDRLWALDVHTGAPRSGWPVALPIDQYHEHVWGAIALGNGHVYFAIASYCDRRPYSGRVFSVATASGALDHSWTTVTTPGGEPGGGGIWGWGGVALTSDGHVWAASANANIPGGADEATDHAESIIELSSSLSLLGSSHAPGMPHRATSASARRRSCSRPTAAARSWPPRARTARSTCGGAPSSPPGPVQRLALAFPATLYGSPAWDPKTQQLFLTTTQGYAGQPAGLDALTVTRQCRLRRAWTKGLGGQLSAVPTVANNTVIVATGTGRLRVYATATGRLLAQRELGGAAFSAPIAFGRDVAVVTWGRKLMVFRLPRAPSTVVARHVGAERA